jgi:hypothetical protein
MTGFRRNNRFGVGKSYFDSSSSLEDETLAFLNNLDVANALFGSAADGSATLDGSSSVLGMSPSSNVYSMNRDLFFHNLTINSGIHLKTSGYRLFVRNTLILNSNSRIGFTSGFSTDGSIRQGGAQAEAVTHSLGGSTTYRSATEPTPEEGGANFYNQPLNAARGYSITAGIGAPVFLRGGAGGQTGAGGGVVIIAARYIVVKSGTAYFSAPGDSGSGGGGGGVVVVVSSNDVLNSSVTTDVSGGTGGANGRVVYCQVS